MQRSFAAVATAAVAVSCTAAAQASIVRTVDIGPLGPIGSDSDAEQDMFRPTANIGGETLGRVDVFFADGKAITVGALQFGPGTSFIGQGSLDNFGGDPAGGNWVAAVTWGLLDKDGGVITTEFRPAGNIASVGLSFGILQVPADIPENTEVHGFFFELSDGQAGPLPGNASVSVGFVGRVTIVPGPGSLALLGLAGLGAARRRR